MQTGNLIGGEWVAAREGATLAVRNPATDALLAEVPACGADETRAAIAAASAALPAWRALAAADRCRPLRRLAELMVAEQDRLAALMTAEQGKPLAEARGEVAYAASFIEWAAEEGRRIYGETIPASTPDKRLLVLRQALGVAGIITPFNFPAAMIARKLGPALACGCTVVVKPAEEVPLTALALGELCLRAGLPPGTVNIITGDPPAIAGEMLANPAVRKLSFTGSTEVGQQLMAGAARNVTRLSLELGGHAPFLVFDDADLPRAVAGALASKFRNAGQTCICANRFLVQAGVHDRFRDAMRAAMEALVVGEGTRPGVQIGPLISDAAMERVDGHVQDAVSRGARLVTGGRRVRPAGPAVGAGGTGGTAVAAGLADRFYAPTLLEGAGPGMRCWSEETFGPVVPLRSFRDEAEAIALANDTPYGLAGYVFTRDAARLMRVAEALECGVIGANDGAPSTAQAPFGGMKRSGIGREGGHHVMDEFLEVKFVSWAL